MHVSANIRRGLRIGQKIQATDPFTSLVATHRLQVQSAALPLAVLFEQGLYILCYRWWKTAIA